MEVSADSSDMQDFEAPCLEDRADWVRLLCAYARLEEAALLADARTAPAKPTKGPIGRRKKAGAESADPTPPATPEAVNTPAPIIAEPANSVEPSATDPAAGDQDSEDSQIGWVGRVHHLDGVDPQRMSTLHGRVIALGYLKFQLIDRQIGLRYRLTPAGKQLVKADPAEKAAA